MTAKKEHPTIVPAVVGPAIPWLKTLGVAALGAFVAGALEVALALLTGGSDPWTGEGLRQLWRAGLASAVVVALAYIKGSPLPRKEWSPEQRADERAKLEAQGRLPK